MMLIFLSSYLSLTLFASHSTLWYILRRVLHIAFAVAEDLVFHFLSLSLRISFATF